MDEQFNDSIFLQKEAKKAQEKEALLAAKEPYQAKESIINIIKAFPDSDAIVLAAVENIPSSLQYASSRLRDNEDVVLAAIKVDETSLQYASDRLRDSKDIALVAINKFPLFGLQYASDRLRDDQEVVKIAVSLDGNSLDNASDRLKNDKDIVIAAVKENSSALNFASDELQKDADVLLAASRSADITPTKLELHPSKGIGAAIKRVLGQTPDSQNKADNIKHPVKNHENISR